MRGGGRSRDVCQGRERGRSGNDVVREGRLCSVGGEGGGEGRKGCTQMKTTMETRGEEWGWWEGRDRESQGGRKAWDSGAVRSGVRDGREVAGGCRRSTGSGATVIGDACFASRGTAEKAHVRSGGTWGAGWLLCMCVCVCGGNRGACPRTFGNFVLEDPVFRCFNRFRRTDLSFYI